MSDRMVSKERRRSALVAALKALTPEMRMVLRQRKADANRLRKREDLVWQLLLQSFATMGNSRGWAGLFETPGLAAQVSFPSLRRWPSAARRLRIEMVLRKAKVRMAAKKAEWLTANFARIEDLGGVKAATRHALSLRTRDEKFQFMDAFDGIGPKYARNVWMDIHDPAFRDAIAVDKRIESVTTALGYSFKTYDGHERFYQHLALEVGLEPWEVDRLLYHFATYFVAVISATA